jgi:hypothetical protein
MERFQPADGTSATSIAGISEYCCRNFDSVDTSGGYVTGAPVINYLASYGITYSSSYSSPIQPYIQTYIGNPYISVVSSPNYFSVNGAATFFSYEFSFATLENSVSFTIPGYNPASMAAWSATAYSAANTVLSIVGDPNLRFDPTTTTYTLVGPAIDHVLFTSNAESFAGLNFEFDDLTQTTATTPLPAALPLFAGGLGVIGLLARRRKRKAAALAAA